MQRTKSNQFITMQSTFIRVNKITNIFHHFGSPTFLQHGIVKTLRQFSRNLILERCVPVADVTDLYVFIVQNGGGMVMVVGGQRKISGVEWKSTSAFNIRMSKGGVRKKKRTHKEVGEKKKEKRRLTKNENRKFSRTKYIPYMHKARRLSAVIVEEKPWCETKIDEKGGTQRVFKKKKKKKTLCERKEDDELFYKTCATYGTSSNYSVT